MDSSPINAEPGTGRPLPEQPSRRHSIRLKTPVGAYHGGVRLETLDWSVAGLRLQSPAAQSLPDHFRIDLALDMAGCTMRLALSCAVVWRDAAAMQVGCRFIDVDAAAANALRTLFTATLDGRVAVADELLRLSPDAAANALFETAPAPPRRPQTLGSLGGLIRSGRYLAVGGFGVAVLTFAATGIYDRIFILEASLAAVSAPAEQVLAPASGAPASALLREGSRVRKGEVLAVITSDQFTGDRDVAAADLRREEANLNSLRDELRKREIFFVEYGRLAHADLDGARAELKRAIAANETAGRRFGRAKELQRTGFVSDAGYDGVRDAKDKAERDLTSAKSQLDAAESNYRLAQGGHFFTGSRIEGSDPDELKNRILIAGASVDTARARLKAIDQRIDGLTVRSRCDCVVRTTLGRRTWVQQGEVLYVLTGERSDETQVQALVSQEDVGKISVGSSVYVRYAHLDEQFPGRVVAIDRQRSDTHRIGLPAQSLNDLRYAAVLVETDAKPRIEDIGMPAVVRFNVRSDATAFAFVGQSAGVMASLLGGVGRVTPGMSAVAKPLSEAAASE